jgi:hypothetical protein
LADATSDAITEEAPNEPDSKGPKGVRVAARVVAKDNSNREYSEDESSNANELDKLFTFFGYESDPDLLLALSQSTARKTRDDQRVS